MVLESIRGIDILIHKLKSKQPELRYESLLCLAKYPHSQYIQNVIPLLDDIDKRNRLLTLKLIAKHKIHAAIPVLKSRLVKETEPNLICYLYYTLSVFKDQSIIHKLVDLVHSGNNASIYWGIKGISNFEDVYLKEMIEFLGSAKWYAKSRAQWEIIKMNEKARPALIKEFERIVSKFKLRQSESENILLTDSEVDILFWIIRIAGKIRLNFSLDHKEFIFNLGNADILEEFLQYCNSASIEFNEMLPRVYPMLKSDNPNIRESALDYFKNVGFDSFLFLFPLMKKETETNIKSLCSEIFSEVFSNHEDLFASELQNADKDSLYWLLKSFILLKSPNLCSKVASLYWKNNDDLVLSDLYIELITSVVSEEFSDIAVDLLNNREISYGMISRIACSYGNWILEDLIKLFGHPRWRMRKEIFRAVKSLGMDAIPGLVRYLDNSDSNIRYWVIRTVEELGPVAVRSVLKTFDSIKSCDARAKFIELIGEFKIDEYKQLILDGLYDEDWTVRAKSCSAIGAMKIRGYEEKLIEYTLEEDENLRGNAALALGLLKHREGIYSITKLMDDVFYEVRQKVVMGLGYFGDPSVLPLLFSRLSTEEIGVKKSIINAVGLFDDPEVLIKLVPFLKDKMIRLEIVQLFGEKKLLKSVKYLEELCGSTDVNLRRALINTLHNMGSPHAKKLLAVFLNDSSWELRKLARDCLIDIDFHSTNKITDSKESTISNRIKLGMLLLKKNHVAQAIFTFQKILDTESRSIPALIGLALANRKKKSYARAEELFKKAALYTNSEQMANKIEFYLVMTLIDNNKIDEARMILERLSQSGDSKFVVIVDRILKSISK